MTGAKIPSLAIIISRIVPQVRSVVGALPIGLGVGVNNEIVVSELAEFDSIIR